MPLHRPRFAAASAVVALLAATGDVLAQPLPKPSRTVFKCEVGGKTLYSDDPCPAAKRIEVEPTRGLDRSSGAKRIGADVQRERLREAMTEAVQPVTGMDDTQRATFGRRMKLPAEAQRDCARLDAQIPRLEAREKVATAQDLPALQERLYMLRSGFRELRC